MQASVAELNAAVAAYNTAAKQLGHVVIAGGIDATITKGSPEHADEAVIGLVHASELLMRLGAALAVKAQVLIGRRKNLEHMPETKKLGDRLATLVELGYEIDGQLV